ncbi:hypothetical protein F8388_008879 [Cannabis sativa]|uniref:DUF4283 domain-containing protein n=1 Tax=Cannabis sativa TaxID=3483 RepID=A0A7J6GWJ7_CANSA|nr:hypothetical protein F8388_008879 [Cannabis sativa]
MIIASKSYIYFKIPLYNGKRSGKNLQNFSFLVSTNNKPLRYPVSLLLFFMASSSRGNEDSSKAWVDMCLEEEENAEAIFEDEDEAEVDPEFDDRLCLVGKLLTRKVTDYQKPGKGMYVKILEQNRFLFQFYHEIDIQRVINGSPWTYDRKQLIIERLKPVAQSKENHENQPPDGKDNSHDEPAVVLNDNISTFISDKELEILDTKRKRIDTVKQTHK